MDLVTWVSVVSGIMGILGFVFAVWVWLRTDMKVRELKGAIQAIYDTCGQVMWETRFLPSEDRDTRLSQLDKSLGLVSGMRTLTSKYVDRPGMLHATEFDLLIDRGVLWTQEMLDKLETSSDIEEIWLLTRDLEPDLSDEITGDMVKKNLRSGKRYKYFYPSDLSDPEAKFWQLRQNVGAADRRFDSQLCFIPLEPSSALPITGPANVIAFFKGGPYYVTDLVFQEVVFAKLSWRGRLWQEHDRDQAQKTVEHLRAHVRLKPTSDSR